MMFILMKCAFNDDFNSEVSWPIMTCFRKETLEAEISRLEIAQDANNQLYKSIRTLDSEFEDKNPRPPYPSENFLKIPKWKAGIRASEITQEMRDARDTIKKHNDEATAAYNAVMNDYYTTEANYVCEHLGITIEEYGNIREENYTWKIKEVPHLES